MFNMKNRNIMIDSSGVRANVLDYSFGVNEFELQSRYFFQIRTNTFEKGLETYISSSFGWIVSLLFFNKIAFSTYEGWYATNERKDIFYTY